MAKLVSVFAGDSQMIFNPEKETLLLRPRIMLPRERLDAWYFEISKQIEKGVAMIPTYFDLVVIPKQTEILVPKENSNNG